MLRFAQHDNYWLRCAVVHFSFPFRCFRRSDFFVFDNLRASELMQDWLSIPRRLAHPIHWPELESILCRVRCRRRGWRRWSDAGAAHHALDGLNRFGHGYEVTWTVT